MWVLALALLAAAPQEPHAGAGIDVHVAGGRVDVRATAAPLSEVLERLSKQIGMKLEFEGPRERQLVTATLVGRTPAEAVLGILDGLGVNYALIMDPTGKQVQTLLISGPAPVASSGTSASPAPAGRPEQRPATSWDDAPDNGDEAEQEAEPAKAGNQPGNPFVPQEGANGRPVKRQEGAAPQPPAAAPSPSPQNPAGGEWVAPTPQPLTFPTPTPNPTPAPGGDDFFDDQ